MQYWWIILGIVILFFLNKLILAPLRKLFFHIISGSSYSEYIRSYPSFGTRSYYFGNRFDYWYFRISGNSFSNVVLYVFTLTDSEVILCN